MKNIHNNLDDLASERMNQVRAIAARYHRRIGNAVQLDDLEGAGTLGLMTALKRFDESKEVKLKTFAERHIHGAIKDYLRGLDNASRELRKFGKGANEAIEELEAQLGHKPDDEAVADKLGVDVARYRDRMRMLDDSKTVSITPDADSPDIRGIEIEDTSENPTDALTTKNELRETLLRLRGKLPERERLILKWYYEEDLSLREIGSRLENQTTGEKGVTEGAVLRLRKNALATLHSHLIAASLVGSTLKKPQNEEIGDVTLPEYVSTKEEYLLARKFFGNKMPKRYRQVLDLFYVDGLSFADIAPQIYNEKSRKYGVSPARAWQMKYQALDYLNDLIHAPPPDPELSKKQRKSVQENLFTAARQKQRLPEFVNATVKALELGSHADFQALTNERLINLGEIEFIQGNFYNWTQGHLPFTRQMEKFATAWELTETQRQMLWRVRSGNYDIDLPAIVDDALKHTPPRRDLIVKALLDHSGFPASVADEYYGTNSAGWTLDNNLIPAESARKFLGATYPTFPFEESQRAAMEAFRKKMLAALSGQALDKTLTELCNDKGNVLFLALRNRAGLTVPKAGKLLGVETKTVSMLGRGELHLNEQQAVKLIAALPEKPQTEEERSLVLDTLTGVPGMKTLLQRVQSGELREGEMLALWRRRKGAQLDILLEPEVGRKPSGQRQQDARRKIRNFEERNIPLSPQDAALLAERLEVPTSDLLAFQALLTQATPLESPDMVMQTKSPKASTVIRGA